jgi:hypothetical protein
MMRTSIAKLARPALVSRPFSTTLRALAGETGSPPKTGGQGCVLSPQHNTITFTSPENAEAWETPGDFGWWLWWRGDPEAAALLRSRAKMLQDLSFHSPISTLPYPISLPKNETRNHLIRGACHIVANGAWVLQNRDAFQKRERANEDYAIRQREKEKLLELKKKLAEQQAHLQQLSDHM